MQKSVSAAVVWSATPTPFTSSLDLDVISVRRMVAHQLQLGISGFMLAGTCGEGPWMRLSDREMLTRTVVDAANGSVPVAVQVTDNSAVRTLDNIERAAAWGAQVAIIEAPYFLLNANAERLRAHYHTIADRSVLPLGLYDRGANSACSVPLAYLASVAAHPRIIMIKDSSGSAERRAVFLAARAQRKGLLLLTGDEFDCITYVRAGYDGLLAGGGIFNARFAIRIIAALQRGDESAAQAQQARMNDLMHRVYGGPQITCWLAGLKELMVQLGVFSTRSNLLGYELTETCREQIVAAVTGVDGLGFREDLVSEVAADVVAGAC